jgi:hypothetical protein
MIQPSPLLDDNGDVNTDGRISLAEVIYILQKTAGCGKKDGNPTDRRSGYFLYIRRHLEYGFLQRRKYEAKERDA